MKIEKKDTPKNNARETIDWVWVKDQVLAKERIRPKWDFRSREPILNAVDECLRIARHMAKPRITSTKKDILAGANKTLTLEGPLSLEGPALLSYIRGSKHAHLFCVTIGCEIEDTATMLMENGEGLHGYLLDRIGSFAVESLAQDFEDALRARYKSADMSVSARFSPGYCDWPVEEQRKIGKALDFSRAGVRLTESCMMIPKKSISGLIGVGPKELFSRKRSQCAVCDDRNCSYRRQ